MTASQFTGGSFKHVDPSSYTTGKQGSEVTIHWSVADNAPIEEQTAMGERARVEAIRLAMGADKPYPQQAPVPFVSPASTTAAIPAPVVVPAPAAGVLGASSVPPGSLAMTTPAGLSAAGSDPTSSGPLAIGAPAVIGSAGPVSTEVTPESAPAAITDKMMVDSASHHQARILAAAPGDAVSQETAARKIDAAIRAFVPAGQRLFSIPQEQRQRFLDHLAAL